MEIRPDYYCSAESEEIVPWPEHGQKVDTDGLGKYHGQDIQIGFIRRVHALFWRCGVDEHGGSVYWRWDRVNGFTGPQTLTLP